MEVDKEEKEKEKEKREAWTMRLREERKVLMKIMTTFRSIPRRCEEPPNFSLVSSESREWWLW